MSWSDSASIRFSTRFSTQFSTQFSTLEFQFSTQFSTLESQLLVMLGSTLYSVAAIYGKKYKMTDPVSASTGTILFATFFKTCLYSPNKK